MRPSGSDDKQARNVEMTDNPIDLDRRRGTTAQKETDLRRLRIQVAENEAQLHRHQQELEAHLISAPAANWLEAAEKARYVIDQFAASICGQDPRTKTLIAAVFADFDRLAHQA
jgi:hypothetical protein